MAKLGLRKGEIAICGHDPAWISEAEGIRQEILKHAGEQLLDVQHVGSTSIPGLPAKPILDLAIGVADMGDLEGLISRLREMDYVDRGLGPGSVGHLLVFEVASQVRTQHLHLVVHDSEHWLHYVLFRDHLRNDEADRLRLKALKESLMAAKVSRKEYQSAKSVFVEEVWARILDQQDGTAGAVSRRQ